MKHSVSVSVIADVPDDLAEGIEENRELVRNFLEIRSNLLMKDEFGS